MNITLEDLPKGIHQMVEIIGMEKMLEVAKYYGGGIIYIPKYDSLVKCEKSRRIQEEYAGGRSAKSLMSEYGVTYNQFRYMLKKGR